MEHQTIFAVKDLKRKLSNFLDENINNKQAKIKAIQNWQESINSGKILKQKEEELQSLFIYTFFGDILGYDYQNAENWNLSIETRTEFDAKKSDGALGYFYIDASKKIKQDIRVVIELKNARTPLDKPQNRKDFKGSPIEQAFMYANKAGEKCKWIIVSNFLEIRLYRANDINKYESFNIQDLTLDEEFKRFYYLLARNQLFLKNQYSVIDYAIENRIETEKKISKEFYAEYKILRELFVRHLITYNKDKKHTPLQFLQFAQTIIDRIVFVSVIKDYDLISYNIVSQIENTAKSALIDDGNELWKQIKYLFRAMDKGLPPRIHKFNGGLFRANAQIDKLTIKDNFLKYLLRLSKYDFESDLSVNILGHIFEQSITDIENLKTELLQNNIENLPDDIEQIYNSKIKVETNQRKIHGIYYTPEFITKYIVNEAIGDWLHQQKEKLGLNKIQELPENPQEIEIQIKQWQDYQKILLNIKILDPACGSGAFLTQAFDFLFREWQIVIDIIKKIEGILPTSKINGSLNMDTQVLPDNLQAWKIKKNIVSNNLYGVDLNNESVEITKLGLWLKTASKKDSLAILESNIKTGNSLIDDKKVAGNKAYVWKKEFNTILKNGGFDIIIGNPPYIRPHNIEDKDKVFLWNNYEVASQKTDIYSFFFEKGIKLLKKDGILSYITPKTWFSTYSFKKLRKFILENCKFQLIGILPKKVFEDAVVETIIVKLKRDNKNSNNYVKVIDIENNNLIKTIPQQQFLDHHTHNITTEDNKNLWQNTVKLGDVAKIIVGIATGDDKKYCKFEKNTDLDKPAIRGANLNRYYIDYQNEYIWYNREQMIADGMAKPKTTLKAAGGQASPKKPKDFEMSEKILMRRVAKRIRAAIDTNQYYAHSSLLIISSQNKDYSLKYILAILNSDLIDYWLKANTSNISLNVSIIKNMPIMPINREKIKWFDKKINKINLLSKELHKAKKSFTEILKSQLKIGKINKKLDSWYSLDWNNFNEELKKLRVKLSLKQAKKWNDFFSAELDNVKPIIAKINQINRNINNELFKIYNISKKDIIS